MQKRVAYLILLLFLWGCVFYGRDFAGHQVENIQTNFTTQKEIFETFGEPARKGLDSGYPTWTYSYHAYVLGGGWKTKELYIVFNHDETVRSYSFTSN